MFATDKLSVHDIGHQRLRDLVAEGLGAIWDREGELRYIPHQVLADTLRLYEDHYVLLSMYPGIIRITWEQTRSMDGRD